MKWQYLLVGLLLLGCVASVGAISENFQSWGSSTMGGLTSINIWDSNTGQIIGNLAQGSGVINLVPLISSYFAMDVNNPGGGGGRLYLLDSSQNLIEEIDPPCGGFGRLEINIVGMQPTQYCNGILQHTGSGISIYPSYFEWVSNMRTGYVDNILVGGSDPHVVGALPSNWTIIRDFINPTADGVYAWNNATSSWVLMRPRSL